jgi:hypothetical protein
MLTQTLSLLGVRRSYSLLYTAPRTRLLAKLASVIGR